MKKQHRLRVFENRVLRHVANTGGEETVYTQFSWGNLKKGYHLEQTGADGRIILKLIIQETNGGSGLD